MKLALATAVLFSHTATLIHDDVVDESDLRRGKKAAKSIWGYNASILVGDFLFARTKSANEPLTEDAKNAAAK